MKKTITLFTIIAMLLSFASCTTVEENVIPPTSFETTIESVTIPAPPETETRSSETKFEELTVVDNEQCTIGIKSIDPDSFWGYTLKAHLENKSADKTYMFSIESSTINGVHCDIFFAEEIAPGKKANSDISFSVDSLEKNGITDFTDIELTFRVYDSNDWLADEVVNETVHIYPYGEDKATKYIREIRDTDNVIIDNEYVSVIVTGYKEDSLFGYTVHLFLVNKTDKNIMFSVDEASINGYMSDPFYATSVAANKCSFSDMTWSNTALEENEITNVEEIEFLLRAYDSDDWLAKDFTNEKITLKPQQ